MQLFYIKFFTYTQHSACNQQESRHAEPPIAEFSEPRRYLDTLHLHIRLGIYNRIALYLQHILVARFLSLYKHGIALFVYKDTVALV